jgi:hypothetical protein
VGWAGNRNKKIASISPREAFYEIRNNVNGGANEYTSSWFLDFFFIAEKEISSQVNRLFDPCNGYHPDFLAFKRYDYPRPDFILESFEVIKKRMSGKRNQKGV